MTIEKEYKALLDPLKNIYEKREAANIADWVFEKITGISRLQRTTAKLTPLDSSTSRVLEAALLRLLNHEPVQYVLNEAWFYKMNFYVNEDVLIPRPETEELVEWIINDTLKTSTPGSLQIIDIGAGSGCIAIALKKNIPSAEIYSIDISEPALQVASKNAMVHHVKIEFVPLDFLNENDWDILPLFDIIVSNPPYIPANEKIKLDKNVVDHEPHQALFVDDDEPLIFYKKIVQFAVSHLAPHGKIYVEVHEEYAKDVGEIFLKHQFNPVVKNDLYSRERMICAYR
jgi:release factor glutamine methyltransferase